MIKTFLIKAEPTSRDQKDLAGNIDRIANEFIKLSGNDSIPVVSADLTGAFPQAIVVFQASADEIEQYEKAKREKSAPPKTEEVEAGHSRRGRRGE